MSFRSRCTFPHQPFFRLLRSFRTLMIFNRYCHRLELLHSIRSMFALDNQSLSIVLYEVNAGEEILLNDELNSNMEIIHSGIYIAFVKYSEKKYQPLFDWRLIPVEIFPEKKFLPKTKPFVIDQIPSFIRALKNLIDYMEEYDKSKGFIRKDQLSPSRSISQLSTSKRMCKSDSCLPNKSCSYRMNSLDRTKSVVTQILSPPISISLTIQDVDIRKYFINDSQRLDNLIPPFVVRLLGQHESTFSFPRPSPTWSSIIADYHFNENDLILFKQHLDLLPLDLRNCIHQLAIENKLDHCEIHEILMELNERILANRLDLRDIPSILHRLKKLATMIRHKPSEFNLSNLLNICLRIDQLEKFNKLDRDQVQRFNDRIYHLARMGILSYQTKMFKKLAQLDLFESEPDERAFEQFVREDVERILPKSIPINSLGLKETIHQLQMNIDRLGTIPTLLFIDHLQKINRAGLILTLNKHPQLKRYLIQFIKHVQTGRCVVVYLERLVEQMNNYIEINAIKKGLFTNQMNSLLQKEKLTNRNDESQTNNNHQNLISILLHLAQQGQLDTYMNPISQETFPEIESKIDEDHLQSLILFLQEQSSSGILPSRSVSHFLQYIRHFAQLGILYEPNLLHLLTILHQYKDQDTITLPIFQSIFDQIKTIDYLSVYSSFDLIEFDQFLDEMILHGELTIGQSWYILDRLIDLIRIRSIENDDIKHLLTNLRLEYHRQQLIYPKLLDSFESLAESSLKSVAEFHSLEFELQKLILSNNLKRLPEEIRKRLIDILHICQRFRHDRIVVEEFFGETMNYKFYHTMKEILRTKNLVNRKQSLTAILQIHKHFTQISRLNTHELITDRQLDLILQHVRSKCSNDEQKIIEIGIKNMIKLGCLQEKGFVEYLTRHFLSNESLVDIEKKIQSWPLTIDHHHSLIRSVVKHLIQLEKSNRIDSGTSIDIQNRLNQLTCFGKCSSPQLQLLLDRIVRNHGKKSSADRPGFQSIQSIRLILNDLAYAVELEFYLEQLVCEHRIARRFYHQYREFVYRIFQNEFSLEKLTCHRQQLKYVYRIRYLNIDEVKRFICLLSKESNLLYPLTLSDQLLEQLKWNGKTVDNTMRDQLLKFERSNILSHDTFEEIYSKLARTSDLSSCSFDEPQSNQLFDNLFEKINDLLHDDQLEFNQSIEIKEQLYLLEEMLAEDNLSTVITFESRLFNTSTFEEFQEISQQLKTYVYREQFRLSKAHDLISKWHLNANKQIVKFLDELAHLNRLYSNSTKSIFNRYFDTKQLNSRSLIKDLQRLKLHALIQRQATDCIRSIEFQLSKTDFKHRLDEILIRTLEHRLTELFTNVSRPFDPSFRNDIEKKLHDLLESYIKCNREEYSFEQLFTSFDSQINTMKPNLIRTSKNHYHQDSFDALVPTISPSLQSLQSI